MSKVYICTGDKTLNEELQRYMKEVKTEIISWDDVERLSEGTLIWTPLLSGNDKAMTESYLDTLKKAGIQSLLICPYKEWINEFDNQGYTGFIHVENGEITVDDIYQALEMRKEETPAYRVVRKKKEPKHAEPEKETAYHAFWSAKPGMGVSTLSQSVAIELAKRGRKVLFVELDTFYPDAAFRWGLAGENHGLQKYVQEAGGNPSVMSYILNKSIWMDEYNVKEFRDTVRQLPDSLFLFAPTAIDLRKPASLNAGQVQSVLEQFEGHFDDVVIDVPSELIHAATVPSLHRADAVYILLDDKSTHLLLTMKAIEAIKNIIGEKYHYVVNRFFDQEVMDEIKASFGQNPLFVLPCSQDLGKNSYESPYVTDKEYLKVVQAFVKYMTGETEEVVLEKKKGRVKKEKKQVEKEKPNRLMEFLSLKRQEA